MVTSTTVESWNSQQTDETAGDAQVVSVETMAVRSVPTHTSAAQEVDPEFDYGPAQISAADLIRGKRLGSGGQGSVYSARIRDQSVIPGKPRDVALKIVDTNHATSKARRNAFREFTLHRRISGHPNISTFYGGFETTGWSFRAYLMSELLAGGDLWALTKRYANGIPQRSALQICAQVACALQHMHALGIAHCDVKLENVILQEPFTEHGTNISKLVDFGFATEFTTARQQSTRVRIHGGTACYQSPEALLNLRMDPRKLDVYSLGVLMCELLSGSRPFRVPSTEVSNRQAHLRARMETDLELDFFSSEQWDNVADDIQDFICKLLDEDPLERPSAQEAFEALRTFHTIDNG